MWIEVDVQAAVFAAVVHHRASAATPQSLDVTDLAAPAFSDLTPAVVLLRVAVDEVVLTELPPEPGPIKLHDGSDGTVKRDTLGAVVRLRTWLEPSYGAEIAPIGAVTKVPLKPMVATYRLAARTSSPTAAEIVPVLVDSRVDWDSADGPPVPGVAAEQLAPLIEPALAAHIASHKVDPVPVDAAPFVKRLGLDPQRHPLWNVALVPRDLISGSTTPSAVMLLIELAPTAAGDPFRLVHDPGREWAPVSVGPGANMTVALWSDLVEAAVEGAIQAKAATGDLPMELTSLSASWRPMSGGAVGTLPHGLVVEAHGYGDASGSPVEVSAVLAVLLSFDGTDVVASPTVPKETLHIGVEDYSPGVGWEFAKALWDAVADWWDGGEAANVALEESPPSPVRFSLVVDTPIGTFTPSSAATARWKPPLPPQLSRHSRPAIASHAGRPGSGCLIVNGTLRLELSN